MLVSSLRLLDKESQSKLFLYSSTTDQIDLSTTLPIWFKPTGSLIVGLGIIT